MRLPTRACARRKNKIAEDDARRRAGREASDRAEREAADARKRDEDARRASEEETKRKAEQEARKRFGDAEAARAGVAGVRTLTPDEDDEGPRTSRRGKTAVAPRPTRAPGGERKSRGRLTVVTALSTDEERQRSIASFRRRTQRMTGHRPSDEPKEKIAREVVIPEMITISGARKPYGRTRRRCDPAADEPGSDAEDYGRD